MSAPSLSVAVLAATVALLGWWLAASPGDPVDGVPTTLADFTARVEAMVAAGDTGARHGDLPVVRPPTADVFILARRWSFTPAVVLEPGGSYRIHLLAEDVVHSAALGGTEVLLVPGLMRVVPLTAPAAGSVRLQCGEYCGLGHPRMSGSIAVSAQEGVQRRQILGGVDVGEGVERLGRP